jgi:membrane fusion protein (multidrug efflux system)
VSRQQLEEAEGTLRVRRAELQAGASQLQHAQSELARAHAEQQGRLKEVDKARARLEAMQAQLIGSQAQKQTLAMKRAQVKVAESLLKQAQIDREQARKQLADTTVSVPMAGTIARKRVEPGQSIREGQPLLALVPLEQIWVEAHFKETQLRDIHPGQAVTLHVDTYPGKVFRGVVASLSPGTGAIFSLLPPENATGNFVKVVQRVTVHITVDTASLHGLVLRPGMSVVATVQTS